jgi:hypothetical protein
VALPLLIGLAMTGCASSEKPTADGTSLRDSLSVSRGDDVVTMLTGNDHGLELRKWLIEDDPALIAEAMETYARAEVLPEELSQRWRRNGLRLVRVSVDDLLPLLEAIGGTGLDVQGWHGQILDWSAIHSLSLGTESMPLAVDGHVRRFAGGEIALLARSWAVQMEDGPYLQLELLPVHRRRSSTTDLRRLLENAAPEQEPFTSMAADLELEEGFAYLLMYESPDVVWRLGDDPAPEATANQGSGPGVGPEVFVPVTVGQLLLWTDVGQASRGILVFLPRIPRALYAPEQLAADAGLREAP